MQKPGNLAETRNLKLCHLDGVRRLLARAEYMLLALPMGGRVYPDVICAQSRSGPEWNDLLRIATIELEMLVAQGGCPPVLVHRDDYHRQIEIVCCVIGDNGRA